VVVGGEGAFGQTRVLERTTMVTPIEGFNFDSMLLHMHRSSAGNCLSFEQAAHPANLEFWSMAQDGTGKDVMGGGGVPPKFAHDLVSNRRGTMSMSFMISPRFFLKSFLHKLNPPTFWKLLIPVHWSMSALVRQF